MSVLVFFLSYLRKVRSLSSLIFDVDLFLAKNVAEHFITGLNSQFQPKSLKVLHWKASLQGLFKSS